MLLLILASIHLLHLPVPSLRLWPAGLSDPASLQSSETESIHNTDSMPGASKRRQQVARREAAEAGVQFAFSSTGERHVVQPQQPQEPQELQEPQATSTAPTNQPTAVTMRGGASNQGRAPPSGQRSGSIVSTATAQSGPSGSSMPMTPPQGGSGAAASIGGGPSRDPARDPQNLPSVRDINRKLDLPYEAFKLDGLVSLPLLSTHFCQ